MNLRRGLFRAWVVASVVWVGACILRYNFSCFFGSYSGCEWWAYPTLNYYVSPNDYVEVLAKTFGVPIAAFVIGIAALWAAKGFQE